MLLYAGLYGFKGLLLAGFSCSRLGHIGVVVDPRALLKPY